MSTLTLFKRLLDNPTAFEDGRGRMEVLYESDGVVLKRSTSKKFVMRGLHHQTAPATQTKIIRVVTGKIIDFIADPADADEVVWWKHLIPSDGWVMIDKKFAHGFYATEDVAFEYFCDGRYAPEHERTYLITDLLKRELRIENLVMSEKDQSGQPFGRSLREF